MNKRIPLFIVVLCTPVLLLAQRRNPNIPSTTKIYNEEGKVQMLIYYNPACKCKEYSEFYSDGKLYAKRRFRVEDNKEIVDGEDITYFHDGSIKIYKQWKDALPIGRFYFNSDKDKLEHEEFYDGKYKTGTWRYYDGFGRIIREQVYEPNQTLWNSKRDNAVYKYYLNGNLSRTEKVTNGGKKIGGKKVNTTARAGPIISTHDGKKLYELKCRACHAFDKDGYGPGVINFKKGRSNAWLVKWVKDAQQLIDAGDKEAIALYKRWQNKKHSPQDKLNTEQIQSILKFLKL